MARNTGINYAIKNNIPYIVFADADDCFFCRESVNILYKQIKNYDLVIGSFIEEYGENNEIYKDLDTWLFGKMYKTNIIKNNKIKFFSEA
jgi:hypothetical protein